MTSVQPPESVRFADEAKTVLAITWRDGHASTYPTEYLRGWCPCAVCQGHGRGQSFRAAPSDTGTRLAALRQVGAYALGLAWKDGHDSGIYTWEWLRRLCPCPGCDGPEAGTDDDVVERCREQSA